MTKTVVLCAAVIIPILSILICHIPEREAKLGQLYNVLIPQVRKRNDVEVLVNSIPRGKITVGEKRNLLLQSAKGKYVCFIDDDDLVSAGYIEKIMEAAKLNRDCIGFAGLYRRPGRSDWTFRHSITVNRWCRDKVKRIYFRSPNHLNPIKREIALSVGFKPINVGEDKDFSDRIKPLIRSECFIESVIYIYQKK
jgi:glycosyltransferase involved in cell wall biosynthesis